MEKKQGLVSLRIIMNRTLKKYNIADKIVRIDHFWQKSRIDNFHFLFWLSYNKMSKSY